MPRRHPQPGGHAAVAGRHRRERGGLRSNLFVIEAYTRQMLVRLVSLAGLGLLATLASARVAAHNQVVERAHDNVAASYHRILLLARHAEYDTLHVGTASLGVAAVIIAELIGTVALIALLIGSAERRNAGGRSSAPTPSAAHRRAGSTGGVSRLDPMSR